MQSDTTTPDQSGLGSNVNEGVLHTSHISGTGGHHFLRILPLSKGYSLRILNPAYKVISETGVYLQLNINEFLFVCNAADSFYRYYIYSRKLLG